MPSRRMTMGSLPQTFCWTKIGPEAGEDVATIRLRKEWERQLGEGQFFWGVGQSLGDSPADADRGHAGLPVVFSPMLSKAKAIDRAPEGVLLWNAWIDDTGETQSLPSYCFITSRSVLPSGRAKERHYALVCVSDRELHEEVECWITPSQLRNFAANTLLGASQVTAIVRMQNAAPEEPASRIRYPVSFIASLKPPYIVRLAQPTPMTETDLQHVRTACASGNITEWRALVLNLRKRATTLPSPSQRMFEFDFAARDRVVT